MNFQVSNYISKELPRMFQSAKRKAENALHYLSDLIKFCSEKFFSSIESLTNILRGRVTHLTPPKAAAPVEQTPAAAALAPVAEQTPAAAALAPVAEQTPAAAALAPVAEQASVAPVALPNLPESPKEVLAQETAKPTEEVPPQGTPRLKSPVDRLSSIANEAYQRAKTLSLDEEVTRMVSLARGFFSKPEDIRNGVNQQLLDPFYTSVSPLEPDQEPRARE